MPILSIHTTYLVSAYEGYVPWCNPYIDSCTSISATGRHGSAFYIFKATMIPAALFLAIYWVMVCDWLKGLGDWPDIAKTIMTVGIIASLFLVIYTLALGAAGVNFRLQRKIGIIVYFTFTFMAQLLLIWRLGKLPGQPLHLTPLLALCYFLLGTGLFTLILNTTTDNYSDYEDAFEWVLALGIHLYFLATWKSWRDTGYPAQLST